MGSIIVCESQVLGERVDVPGTAFGLHYSSDRTPGYKNAYRVTIPLVGQTVPTGLYQVELEVQVAGQRIQYGPFTPTPGLTQAFTWDGKDVLPEKDAPGPAADDGRHHLRVRHRNVEPRLPGVEWIGQVGTGPPSRASSAANPSAQPAALDGLLGAWDARGVGIGGWTSALITRRPFRCSTAATARARTRPSCPTSSLPSQA